MTLCRMLLSLQEKSAARHSLLEELATALRQCSRGSGHPRVMEEPSNSDGQTPFYRQANLRIMHAPDNGEADSIHQLAC
jgi:hypothetical protein